MNESISLAKSTLLGPAANSVSLWNMETTNPSTNGKLSQYLLVPDFMRLGHVWKSINFYSSAW